MKIIRKSATQVLFWAICVLLLATGVAGQRREFKRITSNLPPIDHVELLLLRVNDGFPREGGIAKHKLVSGHAARRIAASWRSQDYNFGMSACHFPHFGIKFFSRRRLVAYASVCWSCQDIGFEKPALSGTQSFDGESKKGQELQKVFLDAYPEVKNNPNIHIR